MDPQVVLEALARVLASEGFTRNERQSRFLRFLVERELSGQHVELKESVLAVEVFGRKADYDPRLDGVVRTEALRLRARLAKYYESEGREDAVVIELPKGGYRPVFREPAVPASAPHPLVSAEGEAGIPASPVVRRRWSMGAILGLGGIAVATLGAIWASGFAPSPGVTPRSELAPISFVIPPAPGTTWGIFPPDPEPAVSPDGRYIAVVAKSNNGLGVWLHDVESGTSRLLASIGSGDGSPFWAPDSTAVAYCSSAGVLVIDIGSRAAEVVKAPQCSAGSWSSSSGWLLTTNNGLVQVPTPGAPPIQLTHVDRARGEMRHRYGGWLPDGQHFVFLVLGETPDVRGIYLGARDSTAPRRLLRDYSQAAYVSADGRGLLLFVRGATLVAQRFDEPWLEPTGPIFSLGDLVRLGIVGRGASFAASARLLVYRSGAAYQPTRLIWVDRAGRELGEVGPDTAYRLGPSLSADERTLIYGRFNNDTNSVELWTTDLRRSISEPFLRPGYSVESPAWSPDGRSLAYLSAERGAHMPVVVADGSAEPRPIGPASGGQQYLEWTADSRYVLRRDGEEVRAFPIGGDSEPLTALPHDAVDARVSPDGHWLAYSVIETTRPEVYLERFGGGGKVRVSTDGGFNPRWRADGRELFFRAPEGRLMSVGIRLGDTAEIGTPQLLFRAAFEEYGSALAGNPDYLVTRSGDRFLITLPVVQMKPLTAKLNWRSMLPAE